MVVTRLMEERLCNIRRIYGFVDSQSFPGKFMTRYPDGYHQRLQSIEDDSNRYVLYTSLEDSSLYDGCTIKDVSPEKILTLADVEEILNLQSMFYNPITWEDAKSMMRPPYGSDLSDLVVNYVKEYLSVRGLLFEKKPSPEDSSSGEKACSTEELPKKSKFSFKKKELCTDIRSKIKALVKNSSTLGEIKKLFSEESSMEDAQILIEIKKLLQI